MSTQPLVSVIMPAYNCEQYIAQSIQSIINQTYKNWELVVVDDQSSDNTVSVINQFDDERIQLIQLEKNSGAAIARNTAIEAAKGDFLAFLDSDDLWHAQKLEKQLIFMQGNDYDFTCTQYANMNESGKLIDITLNHKELDYDGLLKYGPGNSTVMYNAKKLGKFYIPNIRKRNDFVMWLKVIKDAKTLYGLQEPLTYYRVRENSLSIDKKSLVKYQWQVYRKIEHLSLPKSIYLLIHKVLMVKFKWNKTQNGSY